MLHIDFDVELTINDKPVNVREMLDVNQDDLSNEFAAQASRYAYVAVMTAQAEWAMNEADDAVKQEEAAAFMEFKKLICDNGKSMTDDQAEQMVKLDEACVVIRRKYNEAKYKFKVLQALARSFEQRADMLQSLGAKARAEYDMTAMKTSEIPSSRKPAAR